MESGFRITTSQIVGGFVLPVAFAFYGIYSWATGEALIIGTNVGLYRVTGAQAIAAGVCGFGLAIACHFHFFWGTTPILWRVAVVGRLIGFLAWLVALGFLIWTMAMDHWQVRDRQRGILGESHLDIAGQSQVGPWYYFAYDEGWRIVATYRAADTSPKEQFVYHDAGLGGLIRAS